MQGFSESLSVGLLEHERAVIRVLWKNHHMWRKTLREIIWTARRVLRHLSILVSPGATLQLNKGSSIPEIVLRGVRLV